jgi:hypothetical protein
MGIKFALTDGESEGLPTQREAIMRASVWCIGAFALLIGGDLAGQQRGIRPVPKHDGFWFSIGAGGGWEDFDGSLGTEGRGGAFSLRMGGTPNARFLIGGEVTGWFNDARGSDLARFNVMLSGLAYPSRAGGWFLKGGFGFAQHSYFGLERNGLGTAVGTGVDLRVGRNFYITPTIDYLGQFFDDSTTGVLLFTMGVTWH